MVSLGTLLIFLLALLCARICKFNTFKTMVVAGLDCKRGSVDLMFVISGSRHLGLTGFDLLKRFVSRTVSALPGRAAPVLL